MSGKRKDHQGRVLRTGESQRKDLIYQYRYTNPLGKRCTVYAPTLQELRSKESEIQIAALNGEDYESSTMNVIELVEQYVATKQSVRTHTRAVYQTVINFLNRDSFGKRQIKDVKVLDAKRLVVRLKQEGRKYNTIASMRGVLRPAFEMAVEDDVLRKNPFSFPLSSVIPNDAQSRVALTQEQQVRWLSFLEQDAVYSKYTDITRILIETGLRIGELCGLTFDDIDLEKGTIRVDHQMRFHERHYQITDTKTKASHRIVPLTAAAADSIRRIMASRPKLDIEYTVDGLSGFLILNREGKPQMPATISRAMNSAMTKFNDMHPDQPMPQVTPHVLRHTFCTNMVNAGIDVKALQYVMGHASVNMTLNVYSHATHESAMVQMGRVVPLVATTTQDKRKAT